MDMDDVNIGHRFFCRHIVVVQTVVSVYVLLRIIVLIVVLIVVCSLYSLF
jgi:hypothetical protein